MVISVPAEIIKTIPVPAKETIPTPVTQVTYSSWADEVEAADLQAEASKATERDDKELVDYSPSPIRADINMVYYLPAEFRAIDEDGVVAQIDFGPRDAIFEKPREPVKHLKPLYVRGHINGKPVSRMMVDGGAVVNLMPYSVF